MMYEAGSLTYVSIHNEKRAAGQRAAARLSGVRAGAAARRLAKLSGALLVFLMLFAGLSFMQLNATGDHVEPAAPDEATVVVATGETLWEIARRVMPEVPDTRKAVYLIKQRNGLPSSSIQAGQLLVIPSRAD